MIKKIVIIILITLIVISLGVIGFIIISQNQNLDFNRLKFWSTPPQINEPKIPANFFPQATSSSETKPNLVINSSTSSDIIDEQTLDNKLDLWETGGVVIAGLTVIQEDNQEKLLFVDKTTGHLYEINKEQNFKRLSNETILGIGEVYWGKDKEGDHLLIRTKKDGESEVKNTSITIKKAKAGELLVELSQKALSPEILRVAISPNKNKIFTLEKTLNGVTAYLNDWSGKSKQKIWSFPLKEWQVSWPKDNIIGLNSSPSYNDSGYLYFLNPDKGTLSEILKGINGLTTKISPDGEKLVFSRSGLNQFQLLFYDLKTKKTESFGVNTLPEKCVWVTAESLYCAVPRTIPSALYPDHWYQGKISFTDDLWLINTTQKTTLLISNLKENYDLINLNVAQKTNQLFAINKTDNSLVIINLPLP